VNFKYCMKRDFDQWLASLGPAAPVKTLTELRQRNLAHAKAGAIKYGQMNLEADRARNEADVKKDQLLSRTNGIDSVLRANHLDAILTPASSAADLSGRAGYPLIVVPYAMVPNGAGQQRENPFPAGFNRQPAPYGVGFTGPACSEPPFARNRLRI
jgi:amidase